MFLFVCFRQEKGRGVFRVALKPGTELYCFRKLGDRGVRKEEKQTNADRNTNTFRGDEKGEANTNNYKRTNHSKTGRLNLSQITAV